MIPRLCLEYGTRTLTILGVPTALQTTSIDSSAEAGRDLKRIVKSHESAWFNEHMNIRILFQTSKSMVYIDNIQY